VTPKAELPLPLWDLVGEGRGEGAAPDPAPSVSTSPIADDPASGLVLHDLSSLAPAACPQSKLALFPFREHAKLFHARHLPQSAEGFLG